ncbi:MAG: hypothetical protein AAF664_12695, partial [Planctomycetota bacterium]
YFTALFVLTLASVIYQHTFAVWVEPDYMEAVPLKVSAQVTVENSLADLFPENAWQRKSCKTLRTADGMLLFKNWEQIEPQKWRLWPITVVIGRGMSSENDGSPILMDAVQGAELEFLGAPDLLAAGASPSIRRGRLVGPVTIQRMKADGSGREFNIATSNVGMDPQKIWTSDQINMSFGDIKILGRDLTLHLEQSPNKRTRSDSALDRMELIYLDRFEIPTGPVEARDGLAQVYCGGRVEYDFAIDRLKLNEQAGLRHTDADRQTAQFDCHSLQLDLNDPQNPSIDRSGALSWIRNMKAVGRADQPIRLTHSTRDTELIADQIDFHGDSQVLRLSGKRGIEFRMGFFRARLANLSAKVRDSAGFDAEWLEVQGGGIVENRDRSMAVSSVQWNNGLRLDRDVSERASVVTSVNDIRLNGQVGVKLLDGGTVSADDLQARVNSTGPLENSRVPRSDARQPTRWIPRVLDATSDVRIDLADLKVKTSHLHLTFQEPNYGQKTGRPTGRASETKNAEQRSARTVQQPVRPQSDQVAGSASNQTSIQGRAIQGSMVFVGERWTPRSLDVVDDIDVQHVLNSDDSQATPVRFVGQTMRYRDDGANTIIQLGSGDDDPAQFFYDDGFLVGPTIQIFPNENLISVDRPGSFQIPTKLMDRFGSADSSDSKGDDDVTSGIRWTKPPRCQWGGQLLFDGDRVTIDGGVDFQGIAMQGNLPWDVALRGEKLEVLFSDIVSLDPSNESEPPTLSKVTLTPGAERPVVGELKGRTPTGELQSRHLLNAKELVLRPVPPDSNAQLESPQTMAADFSVEGQGPGWYRAWVPNESMDPQAGGSLNAYATMIDSTERMLRGVHLVFREGMSMDLQQKSLHFFQSVRLGTKMLASYQELFDADELQSPVEGQGTLDCDSLRVQVAGSAAGQPATGTSLASLPWEILAEGNVRAKTANESSKIDVTASRAGFVAQKDLFRISGTPNNPARMKRFGLNGSLLSEMAVRSAEIRTDTLQPENVQFESFTTAAPEGIATRQPSSSNTLPAQSPGRPSVSGPPRFRGAGLPIRGTR